jgi:hypothetical protein
MVKYWTAAGQPTIGRKTVRPGPSVLALAQPVVAQANLDINGRLVRAQVTAPTVTEAVDALEATVRGRLERAAEH